MRGALALRNQFAWRPTYTRSDLTLPEIGRQLRVDYVLGGTVRWEKDAKGNAKVRIIPRLSRVADDTHLPGQVLEQRVDDIFEVQEKISRQVDRRRHYQKNVFVFLF